MQILPHPAQDSAANVHFLGHSRGALVNAAAASDLHGHGSGRQDRVLPAWSSARTHITLFDEAERGRVVGWQSVTNAASLYGGTMTVTVTNIPSARAI